MVSSSSSEYLTIEFSINQRPAGVNRLRAYFRLSA
jgi:hypothetical protein